jgi:myosin heavy subunit
MEKLLRDARGEKVTDEFRSAVDRIPLFDSNLDVDATEEFIEKETSSVEEGNAISEKSTASTSLNLDFSVSYEYIKNMREKSHEMSALALQSAIEASRLGEDGTKYVASAQTMREAAESYDKEAELLKEELIRMESLIDQVKTMKETMESALEEMRTDANAIQESRKEIVIAREQYESLMNQLDATLSSGRDRCGTVQDRMHRMQDMTKEILDQE